MKPDFLIYIAFVTGLIGIALSIRTFYRKKLAEQNFEILLKKKMLELDMIKSVGQLRTETSHSDRILNLEELVLVQDIIKRLLTQLDDDQRKEILESLEQNSLKGQVDYLNKIIHLSGSSENMVVCEKK